MKNENKNHSTCLTYNFSEAVERLAVLAGKNFNLGVRRRNDVLTQYYYVAVAPFGIFKDDVKFVKQTLCVSVHTVVHRSHGLLGLLLCRGFALFNADDAAEKKKVVLSVR